MNSAIRIGLFSSVIIVVVLAISIFAFLMFRVYKMKQKLRQDQLLLLDQLRQTQSQNQLASNEDLVAITTLQNQLGKTLDPEIIEFCINSCLRNQFQKVLLIGPTSPYEALNLAAKAKVEVHVETTNFDHQLYQNLQAVLNYEHNLKIIGQVQEIYDAIFNLNYPEAADQLFDKYEGFLKSQGLFVVAQSKKNKLATKKLVQKIMQLNYNYDILKWHTGFVLIVKP